jgi:hypothetical protein
MIHDPNFSAFTFMEKIASSQVDTVVPVKHGQMRKKQKFLLKQTGILSGDLPPIWVNED